MIRRILKNTDLKDIIRSIPSDVINNIEQVRYYVYGYENKFIAPEFTQEGDILKVIIPAEDLETLPDGLLYRQCFYNKQDADYPDGVYNLSITDNLELWIYSKEASVQPPIGSNFLQEDDLKTINGESLVGKGDIVIQTTAENIQCGPVSSGLFNFSNVNDGLIQIAGSVEEINNNKENKKNIYYINVDYSTKQVTNTLQEMENIRQQLYSTDVYQNNLVYVRCNGSFCPVTSIQVSPFWMYITATFLIPAQVCYNICIIYEDGLINTYFNNIANKTDIPSLSGYATETWVKNNYALKSDIPVLSGYLKESNLKTINGESIVGSGDITIQATGGVTEEWVNSQGYATETWVSNQGYLTEHQSLAGYALKSEIPDVSGYALKTEIPSLDGYVQETNLKTINGESIVGSGNITIQATGGVTEEWVTSQGYATETWVSNQGYLTEHQSLAGYALKSEIPDVSGYALKSEIPDVSGYALKTEIPSLTGYATQTYVDNKIGQIDTLLDQMLG